MRCMDVRRAWTLAGCVVGCVLGAAVDVRAQSAPIARLEMSGTPTLDGLPALDTPLFTADAEVQAAWRALTTVLRDRRPAAPFETDATSHRAWLRDSVLPWLTSHVASVRALRSTCSALAGRTGTQLQLFGHLVLAFAVQDVADQLYAAPSGAGSSARADLDANDRQALSQATSPMIAEGVGAFDACVRVAAQAPSALRVWVDRCRARADGLRAFAGVSAGGAPGLSTVARNIPAACQMPTLAIADADAPPPTTSAPLRIAVSYAGTDLPVAVRERLVRSTITAIAARTHASVLPLEEVQHAEELRAARRTVDGGPVCAQAPPLGMVLSRFNRNLAFADIRTTCVSSTAQTSAGSVTPTCRLRVSFHRPGTSERSGLPLDLESTYAEPTAAVVDWPEVAGRLAAVVGGLAPVTADVAAPSASAYLRLYDLDDDDPSLRVRSTMRDALPRMAACVPAGEVRQFDVRVDVATDGRTVDSQVRPTLNMGANGVSATTDGDAVARCVHAVVRALGFPCTGRTANVRVEFSACVGP